MINVLFEVDVSEGAAGAHHPVPRSALAHNLPAELAVDPLSEVGCSHVALGFLAFPPKVAAPDVQERLAHVCLVVEQPRSRVSASSIVLDREARVEEFVQVGLDRLRAFVSALL
jgi:hypothetical protein